MMWGIAWWAFGVMCAAIGLVAGAGAVWRQTLRFRYEAEHWHRVIRAKDQLYQEEHVLVKTLRGELVALHTKITQLTLAHVRTLECVNNAVLGKVAAAAGKATTESEKSLAPSMPPSKS